MLNMAIVVENDLLPILKASIDDMIPGTNVSIIASKDDEKLDASLISDKCIADSLISSGCHGIQFIVPSSAIILCDFRKLLPSVKDLSKFYSGQTFNFMLMDDTTHCLDYDDLDIDYNVMSNRVRFINLDLINQPVEERRTIRMPLKMRYGADPLVKLTSNGLQVLEFSRDALQAYIIDFGRELLDAEMSVEECYGYPFDVYEMYADRVKDQLPKQVYDKIKKNATRSKFITQLRDCLI